MGDPPGRFYDRNRIFLMVSYFQFRQQRYKLTFKIGFTCFCMFLFTLFCLLGMWQLHRYHFKKILLSTYQKRLESSPRAFLPLPTKINALQFQRVIVKGHYQNQLTVRIQNQSHHNQTGYEVLTPLKMAGENKLLLVDRGWASTSTKIIPIGEVQNIVGYIKFINEYQFILGNNILDPMKSPLTMQKINIDEISRTTHQLFFPFILRLDSSAPHGFTRDWTISSVLPERHLGYAIQWFIMTIVLVIAYLCFCCERVRPSNAK